MELVQENSNQLVLSIPVAFIVLVIVGAILVFTFGFKSAEQPPFDKLTNEDRKLAGKKRKYKEKKSTVSGGVTSEDLKKDRDPKKTLGKDKSEVKQETKPKKADSKHSERNKKSENKQKINEDIRNGKIINKPSEKLVDFDEGNWETVPAKSEKKKKGDHFPDKKEKKIRKEKKIENVAKEELKGIEIDQIVTEPTSVDVEISIIEEKSERGYKKEKKANEEISDKISEQTEEKMLLLTCPDLSPVDTVAKIGHIESISEINETTAVFDELGDVWTEPAVTKKTSKKKARRDN